MIEAEAILNSRPLAPITSTNPDQELAITAGNFLIRRPLKSPPSSKVDTTSSLSSIRRWNLVQRLRQELWITWKSRYLQSLGARAKWHQPQHNLCPGDVVLVKDETLTGRNWPLRFVMEVYPGDDATVRVVARENSTKGLAIVLSLWKKNMPIPPPGGCSGLRRPGNATKGK